MTNIPVHDASLFAWEKGVGIITLERATRHDVTPFVAFDFESKNSCFDLRDAASGVVKRFYVSLPQPGAFDAKGPLKYIEFATSDESAYVRIDLSTPNDNKEIDHGTV